MMEELLLIEPTHAAGYQAKLDAAVAAAAAASGSSGSVPSPDTGVTGTPVNQTSQTTVSTPAAKPTHFYATVELDPVKASLQFSNIVNEVVELFTAAPGTRVRIKVDIDVLNRAGLSKSIVQRNTNQMRSIHTE